MTKNNLLLIVFAMASQLGMSQIQKGSWIVGGGASFRKSLQEDTYRSIKFAPQVGCFVLPRVALGVTSEYENTESSIISNIYGFPGTYKFTTKIFGFGPFVRGYLLNNNRFNLYIQPSYQFYKQGSADDFHERYMNVTIAPVFFITPNVALELMGRYQKYYNLQSSRDSEFIDIMLGLQIHLNRKNE